MGALDAAQANVALKYDPQQAAIQRAIDAANAQTNANDASLNQYGAQGRDIIGQNFNTLYGLLGNNRAQQAADLGNQAALTERGYDQAQQAIRQQQGTGQAFLNDLAARYGQQGVGLQKASDLESLVAEQIGRNSTARAGAGGNLRDWASRMDSIAGEGINSAHQSEALRKSQFESDLLTLLGQNKLAGQTQVNDLTGKLSDILGSRQSDLVAMYNELAQQEWERSFKQAQLDQQASQAQAELNLRAQGMTADNSYRERQLAASKDPTMDILKWLSGDKQQRFDNDLATKQYMLDAAKVDAGLNQSIDPVELLKDATAADMDPMEYLQQLASIQGVLYGGGGPAQAALPPAGNPLAVASVSPQGRVSTGSGMSSDPSRANGSGPGNPLSWIRGVGTGFSRMFR